ncbi:MAG: DUF4340 domain-containing protein [Bacteroidales bacterium]
MKKNNLILLISFLILLIVAVILFFTRYEIKKIDSNGKSKLVIEQKKSTLDVLRDFAVNDTAAVNKIFLVDKKNNEILLERQNKDTWTVNNKYTARKDLMDVLLETIARIEVANPVPKSKQDYVLRDLAANGVKCEIYQDDKLNKVYYIGGVTQNNMGTYMLIENSAAAFEVFLPGFSGYLTTRFSTNLMEWRNRKAFRYDLDDIAEIEIEYPQSPDQSFRVKNHGLNDYTIEKIPSQEPVNDFDTIEVKMLISRFKNVGFEYFLPPDEQADKIDSLNSLQPISIFRVTDNKQETRELKCYCKPNFKQLMDDDGNAYPYDIHRLYGVINDEVVVMQYRTIDPLSVKLQNVHRKDDETR